MRARKQEASGESPSAGGRLVGGPSGIGSPVGASPADGRLPLAFPNYSHKGVDMRSAWTGLVCLGMACLILVGALFLGPEEVTGLGLAQLSLKYQEQASRQQRLEDQDQAVLKCIEAKHTILAEVVAGRLTLAEAAARFQAIDARNPCFRETTFHESHPGLSDAECYGHAVRSAVLELLADRPDQAREVSQRLEAELSQLLPSGKFRPPEWPERDVP
jgi:hypothetical protein